MSVQSCGLKSQNELYFEIVGVFYNSDSKQFHYLMWYSKVGSNRGLWTYLVLG